VSVFRDGKPVLIPNPLGEVLTPSVVSVDDSGAILVGKSARDRLITHPYDSVAQFKRYMGSRKEFTLRGKSFLPEELSALVLRALKEDAEAFLGGTVEEAVISVPAYFNDAQRKATKAAGQLAGLKVERLINEPTAAAIAYGLPQVDREFSFLVFDLGGGTFDVSILELFDGTMEVHAASGDNYLGGDDFDQVLADAFLAHAGLKADGLDARSLAKLKRRAEAMKVRLSEEKSATLEMEAGGRTHAWTLDRDGFEALSKNLLGRLRAPVEKALRDSRLKAADLDSVILVGGSTRIPFVRNLVARMFGRIPATHLNPDEVVAMGAAIHAAMKARHADLREVVMTDVCPYTLGVSIAREVAKDVFQPGHFLPVIERNCAVPVSRSQVIAPIRDDQTELDVEVYQGESRLVSNNVRLGRLKVPLPKAKKGEMPVDMRFTYDINGLLEVEATVLKTGEKHSVVIEENPGILSRSEIEERFRSLSELKIHPREDLANRTLMARLERLYEESLGGLRDFLAAEAAAFAAALERQDPKLIAAARDRAHEAVRSAESDAGLR
jgi:molecular chaperone HscC